MRSQNKTLISKEDLTALNRSNEDLALTDTQFEHFLKVQHSLGKILYFDQHGLEKFIIVDFMVIFIFSIYKEDVIVYYTLMLFMILKHFFEVFGQPFSPITTIFL
jgi:hypothetical protein